MSIECVPRIRSEVELSLSTSFDNIVSKSLSSRMHKKVVTSARQVNRIFMSLEALDPDWMVWKEGEKAILESFGLS